MRTIGLIGGMSWESTARYYKIINEVIRDELGGLHSAQCLLYSVNFKEIEENQSNGEWERNGDILSEVAINLEKAGADFIVICTNTMHKVVGQIEDKISIPVLHIAEITARELRKNEITKVALLGTKYTMEEDFYKSKLINRGIEVLIPEPDDLEFINNVIFDELCIGITRDESKEQFIRIMEDLVAKGAEGVILGCTEIGTLINQDETDIALFDTTYIHAKSAAIFSI